MNSIVFLVLLFGGALLQAGCSERAQIKSLRGSAGRGDTVVRAATTDSRGNVIVVGSSYSPGLAMEGAYQGRFKSTGNLGYYDPRRKTYFPFATTPLAQPSTLTLIGGSSDRAYLSSQFGFFRAAEAGFESLPFPGLFPDEFSNDFAVAAGDTVYALGDKFSLVDRPRKWLLSRNGGQSWREIVHLDLLSALIVDLNNPCRSVTRDGRWRSVDCGQTWEANAASPVPSVRLFDPQGAGRWLGYSNVSPARQFFQSVDAGKSWTVAAQTANPVLQFYPDPVRPLEYYALAPEGVYHSRQQGTQWELLGTLPRLGSVPVTSLGIVGSAGGSPVFYLAYSLAVGGGSRYGVAVTDDEFRTMTSLVEDDGRIQTAVNEDGGLYILQSQPEPDAYVAKFDSSGRPVFFTYLGGEGFDEATSVSVDSNDDIVVGGRTKSASFPGDWSYGEDRGGFVVKLRGDGTRLQWASRFPAPENAVYFTTAAGGGDTFYVYGFESAARGPYFLHMASDGRTILRDVRPAPFGGKMRLEANGDLLLCGNPVTRYRAATGQTEMITESYRDLTFTSARVGADGNLWVFGGVTRGFDGQGASGVTTGAYQRLIAGTIDLLPGPIREGYIGRFSPDGKLLAGTLYGGERMETVLDGFADAGGNVLAIGTTTSAKLPMRSPLDMQLMPGRETGFALKMNSTLSELTMATYLTEFQPAAILPHPEGGYWLVGSGREDAGSRAFQDIYLKRIRSSPAELPRIDSVSADPAKFIALRPGGTAFLTGEGFTNETLVEFGTYPVAPRAVEGTRMQALVPGNLPGGIYDVTVVTKGRRSAPVRVRLFSLE